MPSSSKSSLSKIFFTRRIHLHAVFFFLLFHIHSIHLSSASISSSNNGAAGSGGGIYGGRHSYSLTTFDPSGNLDQVVRATRASMLGAPIVALSIPSVHSSSANNSDPSFDKISSGQLSPNFAGDSPETYPRTQSAIPEGGGLYFAVPLRFLTSSPFLIDDGTPRIIAVTSSLCLLHTGVGADGRALCDFAIKLALDYHYTYGEDISAGEFLEGIAERVQEKTMKAGARPFGCSLLVGCLAEGPKMYRVDPSGAVELLRSCGMDGSKVQGIDVSEKAMKINSGRKAFAALLGNWDPSGQQKISIAKHLESQHFLDEDHVQHMLVGISRQTFPDEENEVGEISNKPVLFASFTHGRGLQINRLPIQNTHTKVDALIEMEDS